VEIVYDDLMLFVKANPDCTIMDLARRFNVSATRAASDASVLVRSGWLIKNQIRSETNNKIVIAYRVHPDWNNVRDNADGSMKEPHLIRILRIQYRHGSRELALMMLHGHNEWRAANNKQLIQESDVTRE
jgi:hypothetical protein